MSLKESWEGQQSSSGVLEGRGRLKAGLFADSITLIGMALHVKTKKIPDQSKAAAIVLGDLLPPFTPQHPHTQPLQAESLAKANAAARGPPRCLFSGARWLSL